MITRLNSWYDSFSALQKLLICLVSCVPFFILINLEDRIFQLFGMIYVTIIAISRLYWIYIGSKKL